MTDAKGHTVSVLGHDFSFQTLPGQSVLRSMELVGGRAIPVGCRGGGCGVCKIEVVSGEYTTDRMSRACVTEEEEANGMALACRVSAKGDMVIRVVGKMKRKLDAAEALKSAAQDGN